MITNPAFGVWPNESFDEEICQRARPVHRQDDVKPKLRDLRHDMTTMDPLSILLEKERKEE